MESTATELTQLQEQMHQVRMDLGEEVYDFVENARAMTDWRVHWRRHPWAFCTAAALAGYLVVPSRRFGGGGTRAFPQTTQAQAPQYSATSQLLSKLTGMALGLVAQRGVEILGRQIEGFMASRAHGGDLSPPHDGETDQHDYE
jgi:hypothetical protein